MALKRIDRDELLGNIAKLVAKRSTCDRMSVGAILANEGRIISMGYNGAPSGLPHCHQNICKRHKPCTRTVHAEANAIAWAARKGIATEGSTMYCTHSPCIDCAKLIINAGIKRIIFQEQYRDTSPLYLLQQAGIEFEE